MANAIKVQLGRTYPNSLVGLHFNGIAIDAAPLPPESEQTPEERAYVRALAADRPTELDYLREQLNKPQTVALALSDSPIGVPAR